MTKERMGEIALLIVKKSLEKKNIRLSPRDVRSEIAGLAREVLSISEVELSEFAEILFREIIDEIFPKEKANMADVPPPPWKLMEDLS